jgi:hypothetical protein
MSGYRTSASSTNFARGRIGIRARHCQKRSIAELDRVGTSVLQTPKTKREELFRQFEIQPWKLSLATEIKIAEESSEKKKAGKDHAK